LEIETMSRIYTSKKSPFMAGFLSIIPGMGQIYNEQSGKGLFIFLMFLLSFMFFVLRITPMSFFPNMDIQPFEQIANFENSPIRTVWVSPWNNPALARIFPMLWFMVMLPFFVVFSIADAIQSARRINLHFAQPAASGPIAPPPPPAHDSANTAMGQDQLRAEAQQKMEGSAAAGTFQPFQEESMNTQNTANPQNPNPPNPPEPPKTRTRGISGKFLLGIILMAVSGIYILEDMHFHVFSWISWEHLWPMIPLFFGLRLLREYQIDHDRGQFVLGTGFTAAGGVFLLENWDIFPALDLIHDNWMFLLFGVGVLFVFIDLIERRHRQ
jgi:hypothetical protein